MKLNELYNKKLLEYRTTGTLEDLDKLLAMQLLPEKESFAPLKVCESEFYATYKDEIDAAIAKVMEDFSLNDDDIIRCCENKGIFFDGIAEAKIWTVFYEGIGTLQWGILYHPDKTPEEIYGEVFCTDELKTESERFVDELMQPNARNAVRAMRIAKLFHITNAGKIDCPIARKYLERMHEYSKYCKEEVAERWVSSLDELIALSGEVADEYITDELYNYESVADIMEKIAGGYSWDDIRSFIKEQGHSGATISDLGQGMLIYSPFGVEFVDEIIGQKRRLLLKNLNKAYREYKKTSN